MDRMDAMAESKTLTVQDTMWIHTQINGGPSSWDWARLEEATAYQYDYREQGEMAARAARFVAGFAKIKPFPTANEATAFASMVTFLALNGQGLHLPDSEGATFFESLLADPSSAEGKIAVRLEPHDPHISGKGFDTLAVAQECLGAFSGSIAKLASSGHVAAI